MPNPSLCTHIFRGESPDRRAFTAIWIALLKGGYRP